MTRVILAIALAALASPIALAETIYDNLSAATDGQVIGTLVEASAVFDDLHVSGGGVLGAVSAVGKSSGFGDATVNPELRIFLDDGDGLLELGTDDALLLSSTLTGVTFPGGFGASPVQFTFDVASQNVSVADNSTLWAGVVLAQTFADAVSHVYYGDPIVGSTDNFVYRLDGDGGVDVTEVPGSAEPDFAPNSKGLGFQLTLVPEPATLCLLAVGALAGIRRRCR